MRGGVVRIDPAHSLPLFKPLVKVDFLFNFGVAWPACLPRPLLQPSSCLRCPIMFAGSRGAPLHALALPVANTMATHSISGS